MSSAAKAFDARLMARLWHYVRPHWPLVVLTLVLIGTAAALEVALPYLLKTAIDAHIAVHQSDGLVSIVVLFVVAIMGRSLAQMALGYTQVLLGQRSLHGLRRAAHAHLITRNASFYDRTPIGGLLGTVTTDIDSMFQIFVGGLVTLVADVVVLLAIIGMMLHLSVELTLITLAVLPLLVPFIAWSRRMMRITFRELRKLVAALTTFVVERISGVATVQIFCREARVAREYTEVSTAYRKSAVAAFKVGAVTLPITDTTAVIAGALVVWYAGARIGETALTVGVVVAFVEYAGRVYGPINVLARKYTVMQSAMAAAERVFGLLDNQDSDSPERPALPAGSAAAAHVEAPHAVEFRAVHFAYRPDAPVLRGVTLAVPHGETVAVVGATGSGKSTLARLLARYYQPQGGQILVHGEDVRDIPVKDLRRRLTVLAQDVFLFTGTIADNVRLGRPGADQRAVEAALEHVGATGLLARKGGVNAEVVERGANLSTGERQLVSFARALIRDPDVLILDEATAHVDPETEETIERALVTLFAGRTSLIIAHRLTTIRRADRIVVMAEGLIAEQGTRTELLAANGHYARLERRGMLAPPTSELTPP